MTATLDPNLHVVRFAPAKLNLTLAVLGKRDDGYHALHSIMVPLSLGDALTVTVAPPGAMKDELRVSGLAVTAGPDNLVLRAIAAARGVVADRWPGAPAKPPFLAARVSKRIPVAAGLGGGSSDAAAAVAAALAAWGAAISEEEALALASSLGSDVPFFLARSGAVITGRGEHVEPLPDLAGESVAVLLITPKMPVSTAEVFEAYADGARPVGISPAKDISERLAADMRLGLSAANLVARAEELTEANDLLPAALSTAPGLREFRDGLAKLLRKPICLSGSGPTLWCLFPTLADARRVVRAVQTSAVNGSLPPIGSGEPFVAATLLARPHLDLGPLPGGPETHDEARLTVHNGHIAELPRGLES